MGSPFRRFMCQRDSLPEFERKSKSRDQEVAASGLPYRPSADVIFAPQGPMAALTISLPSEQLAHGSSKT